VVVLGSRWGSFRVVNGALAVLANGLPGSGNTTLARARARPLGLPPSDRLG
jgi:ABC-type proline/glycine betaine transport system ATPase subunit